MSILVAGLEAPMLALLAAVSGLQSPPMEVVEKITTQQFPIHYQLGGQPTTVELWYTCDGGGWRKFGVDPDGTSPLTFHASNEGLHGFFLVAANGAGASSGEPGPDTEPHHWVLVDFSSPVLTLHPPEQLDDGRGDTPQVRIRWSAEDSQLPPQPVELEYRPAGRDRWRKLAGPMANTGVYDWGVEDASLGRGEVRITVRDYGGHVASATSRPFSIRRPAVGASRGGSADGARWPFAPAGPSGVRAMASERATVLMERGVSHARRGEFRLAASSLRDALAADPTLTPALVGLGNVLYAEGELGRAVEAFELALRQWPDSRESLVGLARTHIARRDFDAAVEQLTRIVRNNPRDVEAWLHLGDVAIYQGDEVLARQHYEKAAMLDPEATDVVRKARLRLADLERLAAQFRQRNAR